MAVSAKISERAKLIADELASITGEKRTDIIEKAMIFYKRQLEMDELNRGFMRLRSDKKLWKEELEERKSLEGTLWDGLEDE